MRQTSLWQTLSQRFLAVLAAALLAGLLATAAIYLRTNEAAIEQQRKELNEHFQARMAELERGWLVQADIFRGQIEFARLLESPDDSKARMSSYLASLGGQQLFTHVTLLDAAGNQIYQYRTRSQEHLDLPRGVQGNGALSWVYGPADRTLYRVIEQSVWMGTGGRGRMFVYVPLDNALLQSLSYPGTELGLRWAGTAVAQSGAAPVRADAKQPAPFVDVVLLWADGPELMARKRYVPPLPLLETLLIVGITSVILVVLGAVVLARWLGRLVQRLQALGGAADEFGRAGTVSEPVARALEAARASRADEVGGVSEAVRRMMDDILAAQARVRDGEARFTAIFRQSPVALALTRAADGRFMDVNAAFLQLFGRSREEVIGRHADELGVYADAGDRERLMAKLAAESHLRHAEVALNTRAGPRTCQVSFEPVLILGEPCLIGAIEDVSEQRRMQAEIRDLNLSLERRVNERTADLERAVATLRQTQAQLVQTEKLAALGALVAGIAHEINTPLGIGVTATSYLHEQAREFERLFESGQVRRSDLASFLETTRKSTEMVLAHMNRSAELIGRFKMVAVDQTSDKRREFELADTVGDIMGTLNYLLKRRPVRIDLDLQPDIAMDSYPGSLGQVLTNLLNNALIHAYDEDQAGCIRIATQQFDDGMVELRFSDDGKGITPQNLGKIFDPFFTTRFGQGGSGLGLHIVHNLVTGVMGGSVRVESTPGQGTTFCIRVPRIAPAQPRAA